MLSIVLFLALPSHAAGPDLDAGPDWAWSPDAADAWAGHEIVAIGDTNGDGYDDLAGVTNLYDGAVGVFYGTEDGPESGPADTYDVVGTGYTASDSLSLAGGDFDGDGYADLAVGEFTVGLWAGALRIFYGSAEGLDTHHGYEVVGADNELLGIGLAASDVDGDGIDDLIAGAPGEGDFGTVRVYLGTSVGPGATPDQRLTGSPRGGQFGNAVDALGDVNGDGYDDIAVCDPGVTNGNTLEGRVSVFLGRSTGLRPTAALSWEPNQDYAQLGVYSQGVVTGGDLDGDGYNDVLVGIPRYSNGTDGEGRVVGFRGSAAGLSRDPAWRWEGDQADARFGQDLSVGDLDGDGFDDLVVGAVGMDHDGQWDLGAVSVYRGGAMGPSAHADVVLRGDGAYTYFGASVTARADANGDGDADLFVGEMYATDGELREGAIFGWLSTDPKTQGDDPWLPLDPGDLDLSAGKALLVPPPAAAADGEPALVGAGCAAVAPGHGAAAIAAVAGLIALGRRRRP